MGIATKRHKNSQRRAGGLTTENAENSEPEGGDTNCTSFHESDWNFEQEVAERTEGNTFLYFLRLLMFHPGFHFQFVMIRVIRVAPGFSLFSALLVVKFTYSCVLRVVFAFVRGMQPFQN